MKNHLFILQRNKQTDMLGDSCTCAPTRGGLLLLTEELFVLVRGNVILCDELTSEGHVKCAVILACTFFWRSVSTSKTASILLVRKVDVM